MTRRRYLVGWLLLAALADGTALADTGRVTGLPVPRFVSIGVDVANLRLGPRTSYDVVAVYRRRGLPLRVVDEFDTWRQVEDHEGTRGWVHQRVLSGRRTVLVHDGPVTLRRTADEAGEPILVAEPLVLGDLLRCKEDWCFIEIEGRRGWTQASGLWGTAP